MGANALRLQGCRFFGGLRAMLVAAAVYGLPHSAAGQGVMTNGENHQGAISVSGELDTWTFDAVAGDALSLAAAETSESARYFGPWLRLYSPNGTKIAEGQSGELSAHVTVTAPSTGTYQVIVGSQYGQASTGTGTYTLTLARVPATFVVPANDEGGAMTNGARHAGTIDLGDFDIWTLDASAGDSFSLSMGETAELTPNFSPWMRLFDPSGTLILEQYSATVTQIYDVAASTTGRYTVVVGSQTSNAYFDGTGRYNLTLARSPASFVVPGGDDGGTLKNGGSYAGTIDVGDLDMWSVRANAGDAISVSVGRRTETVAPFFPWVRIYGPNGALADQHFDPLSAQVDIVAASTGTYTVVVGSGTANSIFIGTGTYVITLARAPEPFIVPPRDEGGQLVAGNANAGAISHGDLDMWSLQAQAGQTITVRMDETADVTTFYPWIRLYGPSGAFVGEKLGSSTAQIQIAAPSSGSYTLVAGTNASGAYTRGEGSYTITSSHAGQAHALSYVALGDSYSSGEGVFPYFDTFNILFGCHRSTRAYPTYVRTPLTLLPIADRADASFDFFACSGAVTDNLPPTGPGQSGEPPQLAAANHVDASRDLVTLTIGGNDAQFAKITGYCLLHPNCSELAPFIPHLNTPLKDLIPLWVAFVKDKVVNVHAQIRNATPNAATVVLGYPLLLSGTECSSVTLPSTSFTLSPVEQVFLRDANRQVNDAIAQSSAQVGLHFVSVENRFTGHEVCGQNGEWINGIALYNPKASFHPTSRGQLALSQAVNDYLDSIRTGWPAGYLSSGLPRNPSPAPSPATGAPTPLPPLPEMGDVSVVQAAPLPGCQAADGEIVPGQSVRVTGSGLAPSETVTLSLVAADQTFSLGTTTADGSGNVDVTVLVPGGVPTGTVGSVEVLGAGQNGQGHLLFALVQTATSGDACHATPPVLATVSPESASQGQTVSVSVTGTTFEEPFGLDAGAGVAVSDVVVTGPTTATATLTVDSGAAVGMRTLAVATPAGMSNAVSFRLDAAPPTVGTVTPSSGSIAGGTTVTITGTNFVSGASVTLGGVAATSVAVNSSSAISATTGAHAAGTVDVVVTNADTQSGFLAQGYTFRQLFTDDSVSVGVTLVRAVHIMELRQRIDAARARWGLAGFNYVDPVLAAGTAAVRAQHFLDLRTALAQAYAAAALTAPTFTDPVLSGVTIKAVHIDELRAAVLVLER